MHCNIKSRQTLDIEMANGQSPFDYITFNGKSNENKCFSLTSTLVSKCDE